MFKEKLLLWALLLISNVSTCYWDMFTDIEKDMLITSTEHIVIPVTNESCVVLELTDTFTK